MKIFEITRPSGERLREYIEDGDFYFDYVRGERTERLLLYPIKGRKREERDIYLGYTQEQMLDAGRDILGERLTEKGDPEYAEVKRAFPEITDGAYCFLSGPASWGGVTVDSKGVVYPQLSGREREPLPLFSPSEADAELASLYPEQYLLGGKLPILLSVFKNGESVTELMYFVEPGDTDRDPIVWIRIKKYGFNTPERCDITYRVATSSRELTEAEMRDRAPDREMFLLTLADTVAYWVKYYEGGARYELPAEELSRVAEGAMGFAALSFTAEHPHYGHKFYGKELHDNFPPNYIWMIEAACVSGRADYARRVYAHLLEYGLNDEGRFCYRQGARLLFGASATEYGKLLCLAQKYRKQLFPCGISPRERERLLGMGQVLLSNTVACEEFGGLRLVKMCAEADTNSRVNVYLNNNLWTARGLRALADLINEAQPMMAEELRSNADEIERNILSLAKKYAVTDGRFGTLVPFRLGYPASPLTLSNCREFFYPIDADLEAKYFVATKVRDLDTADQDITENTYSNYRYYPETLASMLLPAEYADAIAKMRENIGGELMGMTRFRSWVDNWPVLHFASFLIETGRIEKYLLLLYAHTAHHGNPDLMCYYEQIKVFGRVSAPDCVPSLLTTPIMTAWMFAYERVDGTLSLLSALPASWYKKPFRAENVGYPDGMLSVNSDGERLTLDFDTPIGEGVELVFRNKAAIAASDITCGAEYVERISGNKLILKSGITHAEISMK